MSKKIRLANLGVDNTRTVPVRIRDQAKAHLSRKLNVWLMENRMLPAELARRADLPRDHVSRYILKKSLPSEESLQALARAMGAEAGDLMPNRSELLVDPENSSLELVVTPDHPGRGWLRVNQLVDIDTAQKIIALLQASNDQTDGKRSR